jgi:undecaprenyl-diphosphatase
LSVLEKETNKIIATSLDSLSTGQISLFNLFSTIIHYADNNDNGFMVNMNNISKKEAIWMGLGQACAILPGLSRSGTTIAAGLTIGLDKEFAAKFSFILAIPAIFGAFIVQASDIGSSLDANFLPVIFGFIASIIAGYMAIKWMLDLIKNRSLDIFAFYCWIVGIVVFIGSVAHIF